MEIYMNAGDLKKALQGVPDDMPVYYQRIEDFYFKDHGWTGKKMKFDENTNSEYVNAFSAHVHPATRLFIINAHY